LFSDDCLPMDITPPAYQNYVDSVIKKPVFIEHAFSKFFFWLTCTQTDKTDDNDNNCNF